MTDWATQRRHLGRTLRKAREAASLTQSEVAQVLGCGQGKINKIETTLVAIDPDELATLIDLYQIPNEKAVACRTINEQWNRTRRPERLSPSWQAFGTLTDLEPDASEILCVHSERIPGLLQSEQYMLRQFNSDTSSNLNVTELMRDRSARAQIFTMDNPPSFRAILSESALRRMPFGRHDLTTDQIENLLRLVTLHEHVTLQILLFNAHVPFVDTDFELLRFDGRQPDFAYIECPGGARIYKAPRDLQGFLEHWQQLHDAALTATESVQYLEELVRLQTFRATTW